MNDVQFVEAARVLAQRLLREGGERPRDRIALAFRRLLARGPSEAELAVCEAAVGRELARYRADPAAASALIGHGEAPLDAGLDPSELAAWTTLASTLLNLDEAVTRN
jgi:hypothetical protein